MRQPWECYPFPNYCCPIPGPPGPPGAIGPPGPPGPPGPGLSAVNVKDFGAVGDAVYEGNAGSVLLGVTSNGSNVLTVTGTMTGAPIIGQQIASINWHSLGAAAIPVPTLVTGVTGTTITVSRTIPAATNQRMCTWWPISNATVTGTDDTAAIKAAIDYALQNKIPEVYMPSGIYKISDTLQLGYGDAFYTVHLVGSTRAAYTIGFAGPSIIAVMPDRPAINVQGGRMTHIKGIQLLGPNANYPLWAQTYSNILSPDPLDWLDPLLYVTGSTPGGLQQHSPLVGISVDAFSGTPPAAPYVQTVPPWTGLTGSYNRAYSSDTTIDECYVQGFGINIAVGLNTQNQGDFVRVVGGLSGLSPCGVSVGNTQSRNVFVQNHNFLGLHTLIDNVTYGMQQGLLVGTISNCSGSAIYRMFNINPSSSMPIRITNCYCETAVMIGNFPGAGSVISNIEFDSCFFYLYESLHGRIPNSFITASGIMGIIFNSCMISGNRRINALLTGPVNGSLIVTDCNFMNMATAGPQGSVALQLAINYSGGMIPGSPRFNSANVDSSVYIGKSIMPYYSTPTGAVSYKYHGDELDFTGSFRTPMNSEAKRFVDSANRRWTFQKMFDGQLQMALPTYATVPPAWSADVMTFTLASGIYVNAGTRLQVGWILYHYNSGTIFVVTAVGAVDGSGNYPITTQQQNNLMVNPVTGAYVSNLLPDSAPGFVNPLAGVTLVAVTTITLMKEVDYGTFTAASPNIASVHRGDGFGGSLAQYWVAGDQIWPIQFNDSANPSWPTGSGTPLLTVNTVTAGSPGSITLSGNATFAGRFPVYPICIR